MTKLSISSIACVFLCSCIRTDVTDHGALATRTTTEGFVPDMRAADAEAPLRYRRFDGPWMTVPLEDMQCSAHAECAAVPSGSVCGSWGYEPIRSAAVSAYLARWDTAASACAPTPLGPAPPVASRCSRHTNTCYLSQRLDYACAEASLSGAGVLNLRGVPRHRAVDRGCEAYLGDIGEDRLFSFTARVDGHHHFTVKSDVAPVGLQMLADDCTTQATNCLRCDASSCDESRWLRAEDTVVLVARNCVGACELVVAVEDDVPR